MRIAMVALVVLASLAGCTGDDDPAEPGTPAANRPPIIALSANATAGPAPLAVAFSISGSDPDGDDLAWILDLGDGSTRQSGSSLPATVQHTYGTAGNYTVEVLVADGQAEARASLTLAVAPPAPGTPEAEALCPTDSQATTIPAGAAGTYYGTFYEAPSTGDAWMYEETNGVPGLQRDDATVSTDCPYPDSLMT